MATAEDPNRRRHDVDSCRIDCSELPLFRSFLEKSRERSKTLSRYYITGAHWPTGASMLLAEHGWGWRDKRHLWLIEGTPEQFEKLIRERGWILQHAPVVEDISVSVPAGKAIRHFSKDSPWSVHEVYFWEADKDAEKGPFGPGYLITDKERRRWCVWWDAI